MSEPHRVSVAEAIRRISGAIAPLPAECIPAADAGGRVLAAPVTAPFALPPWTNASMDGYALQGTALRDATPARPAVLRVIGTSRPGGPPPPAPGAGEAVRIFTGAPVPDHADTVVRQEDVRRDGDILFVGTGRDAGANVRWRGGDLAAGQVALAAGTVLTAGPLAMLAALGVETVAVRRTPRVGLLVSGDELAGPEDLPAMRRGERLADVNTPMLAALLREAGALPVPLGIARDDPAAIREMISGAPPLDLLLSAGGVSVGDHDHLPAVMASLGADLHFRRILVRPGGPTVFGTRDGAPPWLGLPGNPVSAFVTFTLFGRAALGALLGTGPRAPFSVALAEPVRRDPVLDLWLRATLDGTVDGELPVAHLTGAQGSGMLGSVAAAEVLVRLPAGDGLAAAGSPQAAIACSPAGPGYLSV